MSTMGAGLIRPEGAQPTAPIDRNFVPLLGGIPVTGVTGIGPTNHRSGSRYAVRSPDLYVTEAISLMCTMHWQSAVYLGDEANPLLQAELGVYAVENDQFLGTFRRSAQLVKTDVPTEQSGGGAILGRAKVDPGEYYIAGSFVGKGGAAADDYLVSTFDPILLEVRPVERDDVSPAFYTRRTAHKLSVFDESENNLRASTVWGEDHAVTSVRADGTTVYVHSQATDATVTLHASNLVESAGTRKTASTEQVFTGPEESSVKHGEIDPSITHGTAGVVI